MSAFCQKQNSDRTQYLRNSRLCWRSLDLAHVPQWWTMATLPLAQTIRHERRLKPIDSRQWQHPLKNRSQANQHHEQLKKIGQSTISNKLIYGPKAYCANNDYDKDAD
jgi:hypothetical protein